MFGKKWHTDKESKVVKNGRLAAAKGLTDDISSTGDRLSGDNITRLLNITESHSKLFEKLSKSLESSGVSAVQDIVPDVAEIELTNKNSIEQGSLMIIKRKHKVVKETQRKNNEPKAAESKKEDDEQQSDDDDAEDIVHIKFEESKELESDKDEDILSL